ncbi:membrane-spanning 4-domains subfamily A member 15-like [Tachysurus ichikawai]
MTPVTAPDDPQLSGQTAYPKGEPIALGTVQIMIGIMTLLFCLVLYFSLGDVLNSSICIFLSLIFMVSGALSVAAGNHPNSSAVRQAMVIMNVLSSVAAAIIIIIFSIFLLILNNNLGIYGVLLVFSLLEFSISISTYVFFCKAACCTAATPMNPQPTIQQLTFLQPMIQQPLNPTPMYNPQPMNPPPMYNPQPMNPPPMYNPAYYNPETPNQSVSMKSYNI